MHCAFAGAELEDDLIELLETDRTELEIERTELLDFITELELERMLLLDFSSDELERTLLDERIELELLLKQSI